MPKKEKKSKKSKKKSDADGGDANAEPTPEQQEQQQRQEMIMELKALTSEITSETKLINQFQLQKAKVENFWMMEKKQRDDLRMELRNKFRQRQDLQEKQQFEIKVYKQKVKHLLHEQQTNITDVRTESEIALKLLQDGDRASESEVKKDNRAVSVLIRDMEVSHLDLIKDLKLHQEKSIMSLRQEYERKADETKQAYEKKMKALRKDFAKRRKADVKKIETRKNNHIMKLMSKHKEEFNDIKNYFTDVTFNNLDWIHQLKDEVIKMRKKEHSDEKDMMEIAQANKKLSEPLKQHLKDVEHLRTELKNYQKDKVSLKQTKERVEVLEENLKKLNWEHEILLQKYESSKSERDELFESLQDTIYDIQQKSGFKELVLEKSLESVKDELEKKETAIHEVIVSTNLRPDAVGGISRNLEDVLLDKNKTVADLEETLREWKQAYYNVIRTYESKLDEFGIPPAELGFVPPNI